MGGRIAIWHPVLQFERSSTWMTLDLQLNIFYSLLNHFRTSPSEQYHHNCFCTISTFMTNVVIAVIESSQQHSALCCISALR